MKKLTFFILFALASFSLLTSCGDEIDNALPTAGKDIWYKAPYYFQYNDNCECLRRHDSLQGGPGTMKPIPSGDTGPKCSDYAICGH